MAYDQAELTVRFRSDANGRSEKLRLDAFAVYWGKRPAPPVFSSSIITLPSMTPGKAINNSLAGLATDSDNDPLSYSKVSGPDWLEVAADGTLSGTPNEGNVGSNSFVVEASDGISYTDNAQATVSINVSSGFMAFESGPVRPIAYSPDKSRLFVTNTPDNSLEVFDVTANGLVSAGSIPVGMEPVAVAARSNNEVWVVNHLSDSVSVVDIAAGSVTRTLLVGDEPRDIVFAGTDGNRAFITTAHRGQHRSDASIANVPGAGDPQLETPGIGRADVWVFESDNLGNSLGGTPVSILTFFADTPRALTTSPDGNTVYVAAFMSGNQTTVINETLVCDGFQVSGGTNCAPGAPGGVPGIPNNESGVQAPESSIIVKYDGSTWRDTLGRDWGGIVQFTLPDHDVFSIDANSLSENSIQSFDSVGTVLFNMVVNPVTGKLYVTNTELPNEFLFEGAGDHGGSTVQGHLSESRISVINTATGSVDPQHLNQHIDYSRLFTDSDASNHPSLATKAASLATPLQPVVSADGSTLYVAAYGSSKIAVYNTADIEDANFESSFDPITASARHINVGGGPAGLVLDEANNRMFVLTRFNNQIETVNLSSGAVISTNSLHNPEPQSVIDGRPMLYDAQLTSGNGETSCASCHIFGDKDELAWNLGDPDGGIGTNNQPNPSNARLARFLDPDPTIHPMKGPMTTQTLKGMSTMGTLHWRGDRVDGFFGLDPCNEPTGAACSEEAGFMNFIVAYAGLVGMDGIPTTGQMQQFSDFMLQVQLPPNPIRNLDNSLTAQQQTGADTYNLAGTDTVESCNGCHVLNPDEGAFGSDGGATFDGEPQSFKVPHLRNIYTKLGMFDAPGDQIRGFGVAHDGSVPTVEEFLGAPVFVLQGNDRDDLEKFAFAFDSDLAPIVGQQVTLTSNNESAVDARINLMVQSDSASFNSLILGGQSTQCDLIAKGTVDGVVRGWELEASGLFRDDTNNEISESELRALADSEGPITFTCTPPGSGTRMGVNRDQDNFFDGLDNCPSVVNDDQLDSDGNGVGDACQSNASLQD
jgi:YVTN family beta-propeller protein